MRPIGKRLAVLGFLSLLVGCDHVTKYAAKAELQGERPRDLISGVLDLRYVENTDVAFNLLRWIPESIRTPALLVVGAVALLCLGLVLLRRGGSTRIGLALLLVTAGAVGNYIDRVLRGYVVDFVHLQHWPVFNIADVYVTIGGAVLAVSAFNHQRARVRS